MSKMQNLNTDMFIILNKLLANKNLCKLLAYTDSDPLSLNDVEQSKSLLFNNIYPFSFVPDVQSDPTTIINVIFDNFTLVNSNNSYTTNLVVFNILCHQDLWLINNNQLRPFSIMSELDKIFNDVLCIGLQKLYLESANVIVANEKYSGYILSYIATNDNNIKN